MFNFRYFVDVRLYKRAKSIADPFAFDQYKKRKIREKIEQERPSRIKIDDNLPKVNRELASKLQDEGGRKKKVTTNLLKDDRFKVYCFLQRIKLKIVLNYSFFNYNIF